jgi:glyoxylate carboligase
VSTAKTASDTLVERLIDWDVDTIFGLPGDGINGLMDALATGTLAMGLQNVTVRRVSGTSVRTTYITGMLTDFAEHTMKAILREGPAEPAMIAGSIWVAYSTAMLLPAALLAVLATLERRFATKDARRARAESSRLQRS